VFRDRGEWYYYTNSFSTRKYDMGVYISHDG